MRTPIRRRSATPPPSPDAPVLQRAGGTSPEIRDGRRLCFYAAVFDTPTVITEAGKKFTEVVRPGAFTRSLAAGGDVYACLEHDPAWTFARRSAGLVLQEDARGLFCSAYLPDSAMGNQVLADVRAGRLPGCSFAFRTLSDRWTEGRAGGQLPGCELLAVELVDVCLTKTPAYPGTVVSVRSDAGPKRARRIRLLKLRG